MKKAIYGIIIFFVILSFVFSGNYSGKGKLKGFVKDEEGNPIEGVTVRLYCLRAASGFTVKTDSKGEWKALWIRGGTWYIDFEKPGYETKKISVNVSTYKKNPIIEVTLKKLEGVEISKEYLEKLNKGNKLFQEKKYNEALKVYQELLEEQPKFKILNRNIGNCYFAMEDYEKAIEYYKKAIKEKGDNTEVYVAIGNAYINMGKNNEALKWYEKADVKKIKDFNVLYNIGVIFYNNFNYEKAAEFFKMAVEHNPEFADGWYQLGMTYVGLNKIDEAKKAFSEFLKLEPEGERAQTVKAILSAYKGS